MSDMAPGLPRDWDADQGCVNFIGRAVARLDDGGAEVGTVLDVTVSDETGSLGFIVLLGEGRELAHWPLPGTGIRLLEDAPVDD